jgi:polysaccharide export outer membrane protein
MKWLFSFCLFATSSLFAKDEVKDSDRMEAGYIVSFQILEDNRSAVQQRVAVTGEIQVPYLGLMKAAGKTCAQLADEARRQLERTYLTKATVIVKIDEKTALKKHLVCELGFPTVAVLGGVLKAGKYDLPTNKDTTVRAQLARAGGHTSKEVVPKIKIVRTTPQGEKTIVVNTHAILVDKKAEYDLVLRPNDVMIVE